MQKKNIKMYLKNIIAKNQKETTSKKNTLESGFIIWQWY